MKTPRQADHEKIKRAFQNNEAVCAEYIKLRNAALTEFVKIEEAAWLKDCREARGREENR